jgi:hypothetical protein
MDTMKKKKNNNASRRVMVTLSKQQWKDFDAWRNIFGYKDNQAIAECIRLRLVGPQ